MSSSVSHSLVNSEYSSLHLRSHQKKLVHRMLQPELKHRQLFIAGTGSGKTIASIITALKLLRLNIVQNVHIIVPKGVYQQFKSAVLSIAPKSVHHLFLIYTHNTYFVSNNTADVSNTFIIIDEAHICSPHIEKRTNGTIKSSLAYYAIQIARCCKALLLLTATPMTNSPTDMINLVCMLVAEEYETFYAKVQADRKIMISQAKRYIPTGFKGIVAKSNLQLSQYAQRISPHIIFARASNEGFPCKIEKVVRITMGAEYLEMYNAVETAQFETARTKIQKESSKKMVFEPESDAFYINLRRVVNGVTEDVYSKKVEYTIQLITRCWKAKQSMIVYSNFLNGGLSLIQKNLKNRQIRFAEYTGSSNYKHRAWCVDQINRGLLTVLLVSRAGSEGLDLKGIRHVVLLEPHFNRERLRQVIGRAVRFRSHEALPPSERTVTVHHLLLCKPANGESWEHRIRQNRRAIEALIEKYRATTETREVIVRMNVSNRLFFMDVIGSLQLPNDMFTVEVHTVDTDDHNMYVKVVGGLALFENTDDAYDDVISILPPTSHSSVDELLYKMSSRKQYIIQQHMIMLKHQRKLLQHSTALSSCRSAARTKKNTSGNSWGAASVHSQKSVR